MELVKDAEDKITRFTQRKPLDMHHHVRVKDILAIVGPMLAKRFAGAIIMPNTVPPVTTADRVREYREEILAVTGPGFRPLMTMYLTDTLDPAEVAKAIDEEGLAGVKYYPRGLTTNSDSGVVDPRVMWTPGTLPYRVLQCLAERGKVLLLHAADGLNEAGFELDPYDQERHFIRETLPRIGDAHPKLRISLEHISTMEGAEYVEANGDPDLLGCSLTPHHLGSDRRDTHRGGLNPHRFWIPPPQSWEHREALCQLAIQGYPFVWLGSDSAPHPVSDKEAACCKGGVMTVHAGIELYAEVFDSMDKLHLLENFSAVFGPQFYGVPLSDETITLAREPWTVFENFSFEVGSDADPRSGLVRPYRLGETIGWKLVT